MRGLLATAGCLLILAVVLVVAAKGNSADQTHTAASGSILPLALPRAGVAPAKLKVAFDSRSGAGKPTPELRRLAIEFTNRLRFVGGLPSCPIGDLFRKQHPCVGSTVGAGSITAEITPRGDAPVLTDGSLVAYYSQDHRQPRVLARVTTGEPLGLVYVIPFSIKPAGSEYGSELVVARMRRIVGKCVADHPNCFAQPYALKGAYTRISHLRMTLSRSFKADGARHGFVEAGCPASPGKEQESFPLLRVALTYADGSSASPATSQSCRVAG